MRCTSQAYQTLTYPLHRAGWVWWDKAIKTALNDQSFKHVPNDYSVVSSSSGSWGNTAFLGMETLVSEVSFLLNAVSVLTRSLSVTIL